MEAEGRSRYWNFNPVMSLQDVKFNVQSKRYHLCQSRIKSQMIPRYFHTVQML